MVIEAVHPIAVVEECSRAARSVCQETMKLAVQACGKGGILFRKMNKIRAIGDV